MKMVKSLLLGSAAGLVAVAGAQAADLPVKAKAVEYVKVCAAYGAGYYYIPGTDTCIKIGGYVRFDAYVNATGTFNPFITGNTLDSSTDDYRTRARAVLNMDTRTQTEYGTLRSYFRFGMSADSWGSNVNSVNQGNTYFERAFIQFAGFTAGYTQSFFDSGLGYMMTTPYTVSNKWTNLLAYTAQFGNGFSATIALEDGKFRDVGYGYAYDPYIPVAAGDSVPDIVANIRLDQAWGSAQLSGAVHQSGIAQDYGFGYNTTTDQWGWAIGGTLEFNLPMLAKGDAFFLTASYSDGAVSYAGLTGTSQGQPTVLGNVDEMGVGSFYRVADLVFNGFDYDTVQAWSIAGQFRHYWTPGLRSALYAGYSSVEMPDSVAASDYGFNDFNLWQVGFNTIWSPVKNLDIGAEILYSKIDGSVPQYIGCANVACTTGRAYGGSSDLVSGGIRVQRNF